MFIGRKKELAVLEQAHQSRQAALIPIYGRRRVGKSELILKFLKDKSGLYYLGKKAPAQLQIREFLQEAARVLDEPLLSSLQAGNWSEVLTAIAGRIPKDRKFILVLDEFQWIAEISPELLSTLQEFWDRHWKRSANMMIILCGSYIGFMERAVLGRKSPLFGRRTAQILLRPFPYTEAAEFHPRWSLPSKAMVYFICGGIPLYLNFFNPVHSVEKNIEENLLDEYSPLFREPDFLLREVLRDIQNYYAILMAIAQGFTTNSKIAAHTGIPERSLHYYLQQLIGLGYVARRYPLTGGKPVARSVRYVLDDPLLRFWFRFVFPNLSFIQQMGPRRTLREIIRPQLDSFFGSCFENLCREALPRLYEREGISAAFTVGEYWDKEVQIDVVGLRNDNWTDLGECKWGQVRSQKQLMAELDRKVSAYPNPRNATIGRRFFLNKIPPKMDPGASDLQWHSLEDLYR
ncbi:MAG: ATP-binding protein [Desulfobacterales bacterium]